MKQKQRKCRVCGIEESEENRFLKSNQRTERICLKCNRLRIRKKRWTAKLKGNEEELKKEIEKAKIKVQILEDLLNK